MTTIIGYQQDGRAITFSDQRVWGRHAEPTEPVHLKHTMREVAGHEAAHAAAALIHGFKVHEARADIPASDRYGHILFSCKAADWNADRERDAAIVSIVGDLGEKNWPPAWPPNPDGFEGDERDLAAAVKNLALTQTDYDQLCTDANELASNCVFKRLKGQIETLLSYGLTLGTNELDDMLAIAIKHELDEIKRGVAQVQSEVLLLKAEHAARAASVPVCTRAEADAFLESWFGTPESRRRGIEDARRGDA